MNRYWKHIKPYGIFFILSPILMMIEVYCDVHIPTLSAQMINTGVSNGDSNQIISLGIQMILTVMLSVSAGIGASYCATKASVNFSHDLREEVFTKIQAFSFNNIDKFSTGSLVTRLTNDISQVAQLVVIALRMVFRAPGMLVGSVIMAYALSPSMSTIFLLLTPVLALIIFFVLRLSYKKFALLQEKVDALNTNVQEGLVNIRVIKAFTREKYENQKFQYVNDDLKNTGLSAYRINILQMPLMTFSVNMATIAILWFGSKALDRGDILIGDISAFITYLAQILMSVNMIANVFLQSSRAIVCTKRISDVLDEKLDISDIDANKKEKTVDSGKIVFENVSFKYFENSEDEVLSNISLKIESGQTVGIIGSTGSGKTSFVQLIPRLYDVSKGNIYIDGANIKDYSLKNLRNGVAIVLQNNLLFSGTIKDNLLWGNKNATDEDLERVANYSASMPFIQASKNKFNTMLNQGALNLSGGQKQRLCIARALAKNTKILILDDSTSAVDTATETKIRNHLQNDLKNMTKIIIAQRITSVINADLIVVLDEGKISALGTHDELITSSKVYGEIYNSQVDNGESKDLEIAKG